MLTIESNETRMESDCVIVTLPGRGTITIDERYMDVTPEGSPNGKGTYQPISDLFPR